MTEQLSLFTWADNRPSAQVINIMPALCRKAALELIYRIPTPKDRGKIIDATEWRKGKAA
ncbi:MULTISPECIES: hypothetical protein [unclassified Shinella]|uniref:hypothetical protein n=1 Tax=unclassified Shinella TaxID=2643062 RepID=UPI00225C4D17|nr:MULTISPECIES: hypothetical protein [unclassified Shinella]MCO5137433.1 hypothetical protein [Shinella sp.]MDC7257389.1 hypothetical protein [Shinella sp. YE25]CAI0340279.1 conserved hypothetical protein [Rhizobiaceae bacterium]CAK7258653.1 conserved protein of unknown function [Shinella sp. WSC3-e]